METETRGKCIGERGVSLFIVAAGLVMLLMMMGLGIDLASLYVGRSEAQRAADAGALAGAGAFVTSGYTSGLVSASVAQAAATQQAIDVAAQNTVGGITVNVPTSDISFDFSNPNDPRITVTVQRSQATGNAMPTFFLRVFGVNSADISASATAEAFNPSGSGVPVGTKCLKPWLMPNCDWSHMLAAGSANANPNCQDPTTGLFASYFIDPSTGTVVNPGPTPGGVVGQLITIKPGDPSQAATSSKFYPVFLPPGALPSICPNCATGSSSGGPSSGSLYRQNIECCNQNTIICGTQTIQPITGNMVGPTAQGVDCLIHEQNGTGQDTLDMSSTPYRIIAGSNNPYFPAGTTVITTSDSLVTVPLYDGSILCPGNSCPASTQVDVVGFMQMFVREETNPQGTVNVYVLNVAGCGGASGGGSGGSGGGGSGGGSGGAVVSGGSSPVPVRLVHN